MIAETNWFEVWFTTGGATVPAWLLIVRPEENATGIAVVDPQEGYKVVFRANNYDEACAWLGEDEYELLTGRTFQRKSSAHRLADA